MVVSFHLHATQGTARAGVLHTPHGDVPTPAFIPVATQGSVKGLTPREVGSLGATILVANTYHLALRPGVELVRAMGGLHAFTGWSSPLLTDSGGFQAYSLGQRAAVTPEGIAFQSPLDGSRRLFTPQAVMAYQNALGADIVLPLDHCLAYTQEREAVRQAMERTHAWALKCREAHEAQAPWGQALFGIVQGGVFPDLREESAAFVTALDLPGYAIGGAAVGEPKRLTYQVAEHTASLLPKDKPRHLLGVGSPEDLVEGVARGVDLFDCALPTRVARHGTLLTGRGRVDVVSAPFRGQRGPMEEGCDCSTCQTFSAGYLHHLFRAGELLAPRLATVHNLRFVVRLMEQMRRAIVDGSFSSFREEFLSHYAPTDEAVREEQRGRWQEANRRRAARERESADGS